MLTKRAVSRARIAARIPSIRVREATKIIGRNRLHSNMCNAVHRLPFPVNSANSLMWS